MHKPRKKCFVARYARIVVFIIASVFAAQTAAHAAGVGLPSGNTSDADNGASVRMDCQNCAGDSQANPVCQAFCLMQWLVTDEAAVKLPVTGYDDALVLSLDIHGRITAPDPGPPRFAILI